MSAARLAPLERVFLRLFIPFAAISWAAMALAEFGLFSAWRVGLVAAPLAAAGWWLDRREGTSTGSSRMPRHLALGREHCGLILAIVLAGWFMGRPGEYVIEGADASLYIATGRALHQSGGLRPIDRVADAVPPAARNALLGPAPSVGEMIPRFSGGFDIARDDRTLIPAFFHLLPSWIAILEAVSPGQGGYYVNVVFGLLSVLTAWLIGRRVWSPGAATIAALLLATNVGHVWFARLPSSEMLAQWLLLAAIFFIVTLVDRESRIAAVCAAMAVGLAGFTRIDMLFLLSPLALLWFVCAGRWGRGREVRAWGIATLTLIVTHAAVHAVTVAGPYTYRLATNAVTVARGRIPDADAATWVLGLAAILAAGWLATRMGDRRVATVLVVSVLAASTAVAPAVVGSASVLFTVPGLVGVGVGLIAAVWNARDPRLLPLIVPFACEAVLWLAWSEKTTWPDDLRRFVPAVLPLGMLFIAGLTTSVSRAGGWLRRAALLMSVSVMALSLAEARDVLVAAPMRGVHDQLRDLTGRLPPRAILLTDRSLPGHLSLALQMTFGRDSLRVAPPLPLGALRDFVVRAHEAGRPVLLAVGPERAGESRRFGVADFDDLRLVAAGTAALRFLKLEPSSTRFPSWLHQTNLEIRLFEATPGAEGGMEAPFTLDVGQADLAHLVGGFHSPEVSGPQTVRWTKGEGTIRVPRVRGSNGAKLRLALRLAAFRPAAVSPPSVDLLIDGRLIGRIEKTTGSFAVYTIPLDEQATVLLSRGPAMLAVRSATFVPRLAGAGEDPRVLGVSVDWVRIEPQGSRSPR